MAKKRSDQASLGLAKFVGQFRNFREACAFEVSHQADVVGLSDSDPRYWFKLADLRLAERIAGWRDLEASL